MEILNPTNLVCLFPRIGAGDIIAACNVVDDVQVEPPDSEPKWELEMSMDTYGTKEPEFIVQAGFRCRPSPYIGMISRGVQPENQSFPELEKRKRTE